MERKFWRRGFTPLVVLLLVALLVSIGLLVYVAQQKTQLPGQAAAPTTTVSTTTTTGNGAPNGAHFNLNIIGVPKNKTADMTGGDGHRIFVPLGSNGQTASCKILLSEGDFQVLDANCTDGQGSFQLPNPDPTNSGTTTYSVWARALGKPGGSSKTTTCATDPATGELYCSMYTLTMERDSGKSTFENVSKYLLYVYADLNADGVMERYPLFSTALQDYYWQYDNNGLKLMQLRFYEVPTVVPNP